MDPAGGGAGSDDFVGLLKRMGHIGHMGPISPTALTADIPQTQATTILAFKFQGVGVVVPIFATYDSGADPSARLYFYDAMGAQFEVTDFAATGSGSPAVRGILYYENNWGKKPLVKLNEDEAVTVALRALDTAAESDTATGGVDRNAKIFPVIKIVSRDGITTLAEKKIAAVFKRSVA